MNIMYHRVKLQAQYSTKQ